MLDLKFEGTLHDVAVRAKTIEARLTIDLKIGLIDNLLDFIDKPLRFTLPELGLNYVGTIVGISLNKNRTAGTPLRIQRVPGLIDTLLDLDDDEAARVFVIEVDHEQPALIRDNEAKDEARPPSSAVEEAERLLRGDNPPPQGGEPLI